jgi:hypothetical protein
MKSSLTIAAVLALCAAAALPLPALAHTDVSVVIGTAPPPPRFEYYPPPREGFVWMPGYWNWEGRRHVWLSGHWENARPGHVYRPAQWVRDDGGWRLIPDSWEPVVVRQDEVRIVPPPPRYEPVPYPRHGHIWSPGHWQWVGRRFEWIPGFWIAERPGFAYAPHAWVQRDGHWILEEPRWTRHDHDHDHDHDHERDHDHDRDHDGIPNRYDRHPDNPYRN